MRCQGCIIICIEGEEVGKDEFGGYEVQLGKRKKGWEEVLGGDQTVGKGHSKEAKEGQVREIIEKVP